MRSLVGTLITALSLALFPSGHAAADKGGVVGFATLPAGGPGFPEGLTVDASGNVYVATFDFGATHNVIYVFGPNGQLATTVTLPLTVVPLGLAFDSTGNLWAADFVNGDLLKFAPPFTDASAPAATYAICAGFPTCALNAMTFDLAGNLYVSDSFGGNIYKLALPAGTSSVFYANAQLQPGAFGFPPFGANGLAFDAPGTNLYIANTALDRILKLGIDGSGNPTTLTAFAESVNGADGIQFGPGGLLWVAANQGDEVVALNSDGRVVERVGSFDGILPDGAAKGLIFPASVAISGGSLYVTNLALPLTAAIADEPEEDVTTYTVSRLPLGRNK